MSEELKTRCQSGGIDENPPPGNLMETLGMEVLHASAELVRMRMPVGPSVHQPHGCLHGGAAVALAESAASLGASFHVDPVSQMAVGMEINANHLRPKREGMVEAEAVPLHKGRSSMVWDIRLRDEEQKLVCIARCTVAIISKTDNFKLSADSTDRT